MGTEGKGLPTGWWAAAALGTPTTVFVVAVVVATLAGGVPGETGGAAPNPSVSERPSLAASQSPNPRPTPDPSAAVGPATGPAAEALADLATVPDAGAPASGYQRNLFGGGWKDPDRNGCDARNDTLARDLANVVFRSGTQDCVVSTGILDDPYTGRSIDFVRGPTTSEAVQIDHLVPLAWAWRYGASSWDETRRIQFANDPINLLAVDGPTNMAKSDLGPSDWLPPAEDFWCSYAIEFTEVLVSYELSVPADDRLTLEGILTSCKS